MYDIAQLAGEWEYSCEVFNAAVAIVEQQIAQPNPRRYSIAFTVGNAIDIRLRPDPQTALAGGIICVPGTLYLIKIGDFGPLAMAAWFWNTATVGATITVWEVVQIPRKS